MCIVLLFLANRWSPWLDVQLGHRVLTLKWATRNPELTMVPHILPYPKLATSFWFWFWFDLCSPDSAGVPALSYIIGRLHGKHGNYTDMPAVPTTDTEIITAVCESYSSIAREGANPECKHYTTAGSKWRFSLEEMIAIRCWSSCRGIRIHRGTTEISPGRVAHGTKLWKPSSNGVH